MSGLPVSAPPEKPILLAGPTASGKSALALEIAETQGRSVVNADALQVFDGWRILTARPDDADLVRAPHHLYGHVPLAADYSVGAWLREATPLLTQWPAPVIVGGTGLYFTALTEGLANIPATDPAIRAEATALLGESGLARLASDLDPETRSRIDENNPMRVQRAWEVQRQTGRGLADWHRQTGAPVLPADAAVRVLLTADRDWLTARIARRFEKMLAAGALDEARALRAGWDPARLSSRAIGAAELMAVIDGRMRLPDAAAAATLATRQYAKRQRSWFRRRMQSWIAVDAASLVDGSATRSGSGAKPQRQG